MTPFQEITKEKVIHPFKEQKKQIVEKIELIEGVEIRRISKEDLEDIKNSIFPLPRDILPSPNMFVLEKYITTEDGHDFQLDQTMRNIVLSLRLLKKGHVSGNCIFYVLVSEKRKRFASVEWSCEGAHLGAKPWILGKYVLHFEEIPALKEILQKIQSIHFVERKRLRLACKRFQRAYEEDDFEDRLIDFMIAFEALFVRKEIPGSHFGQKIANGCSDVLGKNNEEREEIRSFLSEAYYIRNRIVHGAEYRKPRVDKEYGMFEFVPKIEDYLRKSIKKLLD